MILVRDSDRVSMNGKRYCPGGMVTVAHAPESIEEQSGCFQATVINIGNPLASGRRAENILSTSEQSR